MLICTCILLSVSESLKSIWVTINCNGKQFSFYNLLATIKKVRGSNPSTAKLSLLDSKARPFNPHGCIIADPELWPQLSNKLEHAKKIVLLCFLFFLPQFIRIYLSSKSLLFMTLANLASIPSLLYHYTHDPSDMIQENLIKSEILFRN